MKRGDLVRYLERHWIVSQYDSKRSRTAVLLASDGTQEEIPHDLDASGGVIVIANPGEDWPFIVLPRKNGYTLSSLTRNGVVLEPFLVWCVSDPTRSGGPVFIAPAVGLRYGETLLAHYMGISHKATAVVRVDVPRDFGTVKQRRARVEAAKAKPKERNAFTRLLEDTLIGDDD